MLPTATMAGARRPAPRPGERSAVAAHFLDRALLTLCLLASLVLLYRCLIVTGDLLPGSGAASAGATVISTTTTVRGSGGPGGRAGGVVTEQLVIDRFGHTRSTTVTQSDSGMSITVTGSDGNGGMRGRRAAAGLRGAFGSRRAAAGGAAAGSAAAVSAADAAAARQQELQAFPGLPHDFDAQVGCMGQCCQCALVSTGMGAGAPPPDPGRAGVAEAACWLWCCLAGCHSGTLSLHLQLLYCSWRHSTRGFSFMGCRTNLVRTFASPGLPIRLCMHQLMNAPRFLGLQAYLMYHPDLRQLGIDTADAAKQHYLQQGRAEGRPYKRLRVLLRYTACTGLINQQYSHIAAFTLAAALGAELVLPPAVCRDSFAHYFRYASGRCGAVRVGQSRAG